MYYKSNYLVLKVQLKIVLKKDEEKKLYDNNFLKINMHNIYNITMLAMYIILYTNLMIKNN